MKPPSRGSWFSFLNSTMCACDSHGAVVKNDDAEHLNRPPQPEPCHEVTSVTTLRSLPLLLHSSWLYALVTRAALQPRTAQPLRWCGGKHERLSAIQFEVPSDQLGPVCHGTPWHLRALAEVHVTTSMTGNILGRLLRL